MTTFLRYLYGGLVGLGISVAFDGWDLAIAFLVYFLGLTYHIYDEIVTEATS